MILYLLLEDMFELKNKKMNSTSQLLGEKMLLGWVLLNESCPCEDCRGTPLMRKSTSDPMLCVSCNTQYTTNSSGDLIHFDSSHAKAESVKAAPQQSLFDDAPILNFAKSDPSQKISQKLMKGWALLDKCCPLPSCSGNIPLLRDKEGKVSDFSPFV